MTGAIARHNGRNIVLGLDLLLLLLIIFTVVNNARDLMFYFNDCPIGVKILEILFNASWLYFTITFILKKRFISVGAVLFLLNLLLFSIATIDPEDPGFTMGLTFAIEVIIILTIIILLFIGHFHRRRPESSL